MSLQDEFILPATGNVKHAVIFLHGYGANGQDLLPIGNEWAEALPDTVFLAPDAPDPCEMMPSGYQWFSIRAFENKASERAEQMALVSPVLGAYIDEQLKKWNLTEQDIAVVGFSQGAMMALYTMPRRTKPCAAIVAYSGMLIGAEGLTDASVVKPPILAVHGSADDVVRPASLDEIQQEFAKAGFAVETMLRPRLGHGIDTAGLNSGVALIQKSFQIKQ